MAGYRLDDPALEQVMAEMAAETAESWPPVSEQARAQLAPLLAPPPAPPVKVKASRRRRQSTVVRRAA